MGTKKTSFEKEAQEWLQLRQEIKKLEERKDELDECLQEHLAKQPEEVAELGGYRLKLVRSERPYLSLTVAREKLKPSTFAKLEPLIQKTKSQYILPTFLGEVKKAA